jgi:hypothetical protein
MNLARGIAVIRMTNGLFSSVDEISNVQGIDRDDLEKIELWVKFEEQTDHEPTKTAPRSLFPEEGADSHWILSGRQ